MKRFVAVIMLLSLILLAGCTPQETVGDPPELFPKYSINDYERYLEQRSDVLPEDFVHWNSVAFLGEFDHFQMFLSLDGYRYYITAHGVTFCLEIDHAPEPMDEDVEIIEDAPVQTTMYRAPVEGKAVIRRGERSYYYEDGELSALFWYIGETKFTISENLSCYTEELDPKDYELCIGELDMTIVKLLSADEAVAGAAFAEITQKLAQ